MSLLFARLWFASAVDGRKAISDAVETDRALLELRAVAGERYPSMVAEAARRYHERLNLSFPEAVRQVRDDVAYGRMGT